jgi:hypothetical protein
LLICVETIVVAFWTILQRITLIPIRPNGAEDVLGPDWIVYFLPLRHESMLPLGWLQE